MTLRTTIFDRCTTFAGLSALIGVRCYPTQLPENVTLPALVYSVVSENDSPYRTHDNAAGDNPVSRAVNRVSFSVYASTDDGAAEVVAQMRGAWSGYQDECVVGYAFIANTIQAYEQSLRRWRHIVDVMIEAPTDT